MKVQLYSIFKNTMLPLDVSFIGETKYLSRPRELSRLALIRWPDGRPCHLANHWLMKIATNTEARDTLRVYAANLTHLVRFCSQNKIEFHNFTDQNFSDFHAYLQKQKKSNSRVSEEFIGGNHIRAIQLRALNFFVWINANYPNLSSRKLIGTTSDCQIVISYKTNPHNGQQEIQHEYLESFKVPEDEKPVITEAAIKRLREAIFNAHDIQNLKPRAKTKLTNDRELFLARNNYIYHRRLFVIRIMRLTGLRPEELVDIDLTANLNVAKSKVLRLPTKKREQPAPTRIFDIELRSGLDFDRYVKCRNDFIVILKSRGIIDTDPGSILVGVDGKELKKESMTTEFQRLVKAADIGGMRCCLSMFRHRYITREIHIHILMGFKKDPSLKISATSGFIEDVCRTVQPKTGHKRYQSLLTYFHSEYKLLTSGAHREEDMEIIDRLSANQDALYEVKFEARLQNNTEILAGVEQMEANTEKWLNELLSPPKKDD
jgi:hypothetical protein